MLLENGHLALVRAQIVALLSESLPADAVARLLVLRASASANEGAAEAMHDDLDTVRRISGAAELEPEFLAVQAELLRSEAPRAEAAALLEAAAL